MHVHAERGNDQVAGAVNDRSSRSRVGMPPGTLRVPLLRGDAERHGMHAHAERGNDQVAGAVNDRSSRSRVGMPPGTLRVPLLRGRRRASRDACPRRAWERSGRGGCERSFLTLPRGNAARDAPRSASARRRRASRDACPRRAWERSGRGGCERSFLTLPRGNAARDAPRSASERATQSVTGCMSTQSVGTIRSRGL